MTFAATEQEVMRRYLAGDLDAALALTEWAAGRFPERPGTTAWWRGCLLAVRGDGDQALAVLEDAAASGHWWPEFSLDNDPDVESLRSLERFQRLAEVSRQRAAAARAEPLAHAAFPDRPGPRPTVLVLHGRGGNAEDALDLWRPVRAAGWTVVALQSSQPAGSEGFCWDDTDRAADEVVDGLAALLADPRVDAERVVLSGFSQGGALALRLALSGAVAPMGYVVAAPGVRDPEALLALAAGRRVPGMILVGDADGVYPGVVNLASGLGPSCRVQVYEGLGHVLAPTFAADLTAALDQLAPS